MTSAKRPAAKPRADANNELILEAGVEGGSLQLFGTRTAHGWLFRRITDEGTLHSLLAEEDRVGLESRQESDWVNSWEAALALLDEYLWHEFHPIVIHPDFRQLVWSAVLNRFERRPSEDDDYHRRYILRRWLELCGRRWLGPYRPPDLIIKSLGEHPEKGGPVVVKAGRYGPYIDHNGTLATIPKYKSPESVTLRQAVALLKLSQRPYWTKTIEELERIFKTKAAKGDDLTKIVSELLCRKGTRAEQLYQRVLKKHTAQSRPLRGQKQSS